jgi:toxin ParE1/3/4
MRSSARLNTSRALRPGSGASNRLAAAARDDLGAIIRYIAKRNPQAARRMKVIIEEAVDPLADHPNYIVVYRVMSDQVEIVSVLHARQKYP